ncbi:Uncharacterised protein [uncultured Clostridium sp.]|nr:transporter auxin efflux carrier (AEC) family [Clostridium sp. CAG:81]SCJ02580.1 Uncharacterised protein [uncultured Clostridium sp.]
MNLLDLFSLQGTLFATRCVVMTTLMSMLTLPVWCYLAG